MDIVTFAEQFLSRVDTLPVQYERDFNSTTRRHSYLSKKPAVAIVEVTLRQLYGSPKSSKCKISRTEPTICKLRREGASMLGCQEKGVTLVRDGKVLADDDVVLATTGGLSIYVFDKQSWCPTSSTLDTEFRREFCELLRRHGQTKAELLADNFLAEYSNWLRDH